MPSQPTPSPSFPLVPAAAPNFTISGITATSISVAWQLLPGCDQNGVITNYTIAYMIVGNMSITETVVDAANSSAVISPLTPFTNYTIKMAASTSVGQGSFGPVMIIPTDESSKTDWCLIEHTLMWSLYIKHTYIRETQKQWYSGYPSVPCRHQCWDLTTVATALL